MIIKKFPVLLYYLISAIVFTGLVYSLYIRTTVKAPIEEIDKARTSIAAAKAQLAGKYAGESLKEAEIYFKQTMEEWKLQNSIFFIFRDYSRTSELASNSNNRAMIALDEANKSRNKLKYNAEIRLQNLVQKILYFEKYYKKLVLNPATTNLFSSGKTKFAEAQIEFRSQEYIKALKHILKAEESITKAEKQAHLKLAAFYRNYPLWEKDLQFAYQLSNKGQTVFLIDKMDASLTILKSGKEFKTFPVEFGNNWMGDKLMAGDKATPEGIYKIQNLKGLNRTKYYKALLLDYPNIEDRKRFNQQVNSGKISKKAYIGGLIEIHGEGGKGIHWTDGCIALGNKEMDVVFSHSSLNTPVVIVGARQTLEDYLN